MSGEHLRYFRAIFFEEAGKFLQSIDPKAAKKIIWNIDLAAYTNDPRLFKKLQDDIWEFRTKYGNLQYRFLAFWDKNGSTETLVIVTHGIVKKTDKMPQKEIEKAKASRIAYFNAQQG